MHVRLVHGPPLVGVEVTDGFESERTAGVVDDDVAAVDGLAEGVDRVGVGDVECQRPTSQRFGDLDQTVEASGTEHHVVAGTAEVAGRRRRRCRNSRP